MKENAMREMDETEWTEFLRHGTRTGKLSINLQSGRPTVTPIWFLMDDDGILRIATGADSAKARALSADPRACIVVDLEEAPYAFVKIDATTTILDDPTLTLGVATEIGRRYMGEELADVYGQRNGGPGQVTIEFTPTRIIAIHDISG
jgi:PPOX class probable F420-dependent enzyme